MDPFVQVLLDEREIYKTVVRYATALDSRDWRLLRTCFIDDAVAEYEGYGVAEGYAAIEQVCRETLTPLTRSHHLIGNVFPLVDGQEASCECYLQAQHVKLGTEGGDTFIVAGQYTDRLVRADHGWRIASRRLQISWTQGNPAVFGT